MEMEECRHGSFAPRKMLADLPESQGGIGRHKCASCAYQLGKDELEEQLAEQGDIIECAHKSYAPRKILMALKESQAGEGRHKCVVCAYQEGRAAARGLAQEEAWEPKAGGQKGGISKKPPPKSKSTTPDPDWWKKKEERQKEVGDLGEELVLEHEKALLISLGKPGLANSVTHVSKEEGDHAGYDIRSYWADGSVKYIEVKATTNGIDTPFYISANELKVAQTSQNEYLVYRLFDLDEENRQSSFYLIEGDLVESLNLEPVSYQASIKG